jgi:hypothetical protein
MNANDAKFRVYRLASFQFDANTSEHLRRRLKIERACPQIQIPYFLAVRKKL